MLESLLRSVNEYDVRSEDVVALARANKVDGYVLGKALSEVLWLTAQQQRHFPLLIVRPIGVMSARNDRIRLTVAIGFNDPGYGGML